MSKKSLWQGLGFVSTFVLTLALVGGSIMESYTSYVDGFFGTESTKIVTTEGETYDKFTPDEKYLTNGKGDSKKIIQEAINLGAQIGEEGTVLLKNDNNTLPLSTGSKVTMLGLRSEVPLLGAGMGVKALGSMINFEDALSGTRTKFDQADHIATYFSPSAYGSSMGKTITEEAASTFDNYDIESAGFQVNPTMLSIYKSYNDALGNDGLSNNDSIQNPSTTKYNPKEPSLSDLAKINANYQDSFADYGDAAIVVVGRPSNESYDYWKGNAVNDDGSDMEPLHLSQNEQATIQLATEKFSKVIVLINSAAPMDIQELKTNDKIGAIAYIGQPGIYGLLGVGRVLSGKASPSGKLVDTFAANQLSAPAMMNFGDYTYANADSMTRTTTIGGANTSKKYVVEAEGLYTGYKYYETRYADTVTGDGNADSTAGVYESKAGWNYDEEVSYAFGYGMSYTTFTQEIVKAEASQSAHDLTIDFTVRVTNTGDKEGMNVVQIYGQAPYTKGGLEKSAIQLLAFDKTDTLKAGASQELVIHVDLQNIATYDMSHKNSDGTTGTYVLEKGDYYYALGNGAHEALNNVLTKRGKLSSDSKSSIDKLVYTQTITADDYNTFAVSKNNVSVHNQLDYSDWNYYGGSTVTYLSRSDWKNTYPVEYSNLTAPEKLIKDLNGVGENYYQYNENTTEDVTWGKNNGAKLASMFQADWDDSRWDDLLDQVTLEEAVLMVMYGGPNLAGAESVGWTAGLYLTENSGSGIVITLGGTKDTDAPWAIPSTDKNAGWAGGVFANAPTTAASFNPDLWHELGEFIGTESLFTGIPFLWGPGLNTHRASYNGRTGEYYSEDGILAGNVAMEYAMGAMNYGLITAPKHFAFNDQETNRAGVSPYMTEQRARETELRAYQIAVEADKYDRLTGEDCGMRGLMTSFSKIGGVEVTCSYGLMTEILQNEWGFHGYAVTDIYDDTDMFASVAASGVTCYDLRGQSPSAGVDTNTMFTSQSQGYTHAVATYQKDSVLQSRMKLAVKNLLWVTAQSNMMNRFNENSYTQWQFTSWRAGYIFISIAAGICVAGSVAMYVLTDLNVFKKKEEN